VVAAFVDHDVSGMTEFVRLAFGRAACRQLTGTPWRVTSCMPARAGSLLTLLPEPE
jgi:hypothetical protein